MLPHFWPLLPVAPCSERRHTGRRGSLARCCRSIACRASDQGRKPYLRHCMYALTLRDRERLIEVPQDVVDVFQTDGQTHIVGRHARQRLFFLAQLRVRRRGWMNGERTRVTDVRQVREQLQVVDKGAPGLASALDAKADDRARAL